jgi:hypothetical protein
MKIERVGFVPHRLSQRVLLHRRGGWCRKVPRGSATTDGWAGWWPDPLIPEASFNVRDELDTTCLVHCPGAKAPNPASTCANNLRSWTTPKRRTGVGLARRAVRAISGQASRQVIRLPLTVRVLPFTLPDQGQLRAVFDFRFGPGGTFGSGADSSEGDAGGSFPC